MEGGGRRRCSAVCNWFRIGSFGGWWKGTRYLLVFIMYMVCGPYMLWCVVITIHNCTRSAPLLNTTHRTGHLAQPHAHNTHTTHVATHTHNTYQVHVQREGRAISSDSARETTESAIGSWVGRRAQFMNVHVSEHVRGGYCSGSRTRSLLYMGVGSSLVFRTCSCSASQPVGVTAPRVIGRKAAGRREGGGAGEEASEERGTEGGESSAVCAPTVPSAAAGAVAEMRRRRRRRRWRRWREGEAWKSMMWHPVCLAVVADQGMQR